MKTFWEHQGKDRYIRIKHLNVILSQQRSASVYQFTNKQTTQGALRQSPGRTPVSALH